MSEITRAVVQLSGGAGSWAAAARTIERYGRDNVVLLFADVKMEDEDLYRFLLDVERDLGVPITRISDGRTPWDVFDDEGFIGNTRIDLCSRILKRDLLRAWIVEHCDPAEWAVVLGIDWTEVERFDRAMPRWVPFTLQAPLCEPPYIDKADVLVLLAEAGIEAPALYKLGFPHNNCGGFCVKAGQTQFKLLLQTMPERYREHENREQAFRERTGKNVAILRDRRGGDTKPLTMRRLRLRIETGQDVPDDDWGGCGCAVE